MNKSKIIALACVLVGFSQFAQASVTSCASKSGNSLDYGDAPSDYGQACHDTNRWQQLGDSWDTESAGAAASVGHDDGTDDGVVWKTSSDGGATWSSYSSDNVITQGDKVKFKFTMNRSTNGNHEYDALRAWVDWDQSNSWDKDEKLKTVKWYKNIDADGNLDTSSNQSNSATGMNNSADTTDVFYKTLNIADDATTGDFWMRVRVVCSESIENWGGGKLLPTGYLYQGEVEDYQLNIVSKSVKPVVGVPEPSTLFIFALGLIGFGVQQRRNQK
ncbi:PEP-CTERM sorting domain-containing protein [Thalassotalea sp. PLHSN55]|uniref:PEP-CTERM sorting domain-containing protein n=1 Tax=Thalassotalea sp. PLHSN55 TaxID=3435888 RepID=UPI003F8728A4